MIKLLLLRFARFLRKWWRRFFVPLSLGSQMLIVDQKKRVFLVRRRDTKKWVFPGGGVARYEHPLDAAIRETFEEAGLKLDKKDVSLRQCFLSTYQNRLDYIFLYETRIDATQHAPKFRSIEIDQGDFFPLDALPADIQPGTDRRLKEFVGATPCSLLW